MIVTTTFRNIRDNVPVLATFDDWPSFAAHLERQSRTEASDKARTECLTPAIYADGTTRAKRNALGWNWFAADIDNKEGNGEHSTIAAISAKCVAANLPHVIYTTTSSRTDAECFRLMFPLDRLVEADDFSAFWQSVAQWLGCVDEQTKDVSRLFVAPRHWSGADNAFLRHDEGAPLDVAMIRDRYPVKEAPRPSRALCEAFSTVDGLKDVCPTMVSLYGPFVSDNALSNAQTGDRGGRMFAFLLSVGTRALLKGYAITPDHLEDIGFEFANSIGRETSDIRHDARNAHTRALEHYASAKAERLQKLSPHEAYLARWSK